MKKPKNPATQVQDAKAPAMFVTWDAADTAGRNAAFATAAHALTRAEPFVQRSHGINTFQNVAPGNVSVRDGFDRRDYDYFRPGEAIPTKSHDIMAACMQAYDRIGIIRNTIDLMADFAAEGIRLVHPNPRIEQFYQNWARQVRMKNRTERALNVFYRCANVVMKRQTAKLRQKDVDKLQSTSASPDLFQTDLNARQVERNEIPWSYTILNPTTLEVMGEELAPFVGGSQTYNFGVKIGQLLARKIRNPKTPSERDMIAKMPADLVQAIRSGQNVIPLDPAKTMSFYYKKDDWQVWANPMLYSILEDLIMLKKMKLADLAALDGAISHIRLWKLGNLEAKILPTDVAINRLAELLLNNVGGGSMDLIWTPDIELQETSTDISKFLGDAKYGPVLTAIYAGLGIPQSLTGSGGSAKSGMTNNFMSLKTLLERLQYGRDFVIELWQNEIRLVQQAMGFRFPAQLMFDRMSLSDESSMLALFVQLADRDLISVETLQERFGEMPEVEEVRLRREQRKRKNETMPQKAGPWHDPQQDFALKKVFAGLGTVTPSETGVELEPNRKGEETLLEQQARLAPDPVAAPAGGKQPATTPRGQPQQGRPKGSKDSSQRKTKVVKPQSSAAFFEALSWAESAQQAIAEIIHPAYLGALAKKTLRSLTTEETNNLEKFKFAVLANLDLYAKVDEDTVKAMMASPLPVPASVNQLLRTTLVKYVEREGSEPPAEKARQIQAAVIAMYKGELDEASDTDDSAS